MQVSHETNTQPWAYPTGEALPEQLPKMADPQGLDLMWARWRGEYNYALQVMRVDLPRGLELLETRLAELPMMLRQPWSRPGSCPRARRTILHFATGFSG